MEGTVINQAKSLIDLNKLRETGIGSHPMVEDATAFLTVDGRLKTRVKQRTPIGRINSGSQRSYYIDRLGNINAIIRKLFCKSTNCYWEFISTDNLEDLFTRC